MKRLFATILAILVLASVYTWRTLPGAAGDAPVLYWVTDANPARAEQIRTFKQWLRKTYPDAPDITILVDTANTSPEKVLVQGVSGVCADLIDHSGGSALRFRKSVGLLEDLTDDAARMGFDLSKTYPAIVPELVAPVKTVDADGRATYVERQFAFPCNVTAEMLWINREAFAKAGLEPPARRWTVDEFERVGREFVLRANPSNAIQRVFFIADVQPLLLANSAGGCLFNETATAPAVNRQPMIDAFKLRHRWTFESPRLLPTSSERSSFAASSGYGGAGLAMFAQGNYALIYGGRYLTIQFRKISDERIAVGGTANLVRFGSDFDSAIKPVLEAIEEQVVLLKLLGEATSGLTVRIGAETGLDSLLGTAVVSTAYGADDQALATLGTVGPTRMDYPATMAAVSAVARYVGRSLADT